MSAKIEIQNVIQAFQEHDYEILDISNYAGVHSYLEVRCPAGHVYKVKACSFMYGRRCRACSGYMKLSYDAVRSEFEKYNFKLLSLEYKSTKSKLHVICPQGHTIEITFGQFKNHHNCRVCNKKEKYKYDFVKKYIESYGFKLISVDYIKCNSKLILSCPNNHQFGITFSHFMNGTRCAYCSGYKIDYSTIRRYIVSQGFKLISERYVAAKEKLIIECKNGHKFHMSWHDFRNGSRCRMCYEINRRMSTEEFICASKELYGEKLDYDKVNYVACNKYVTLICKVHGEYKQMPQNHFKSMGCKQCYSETLCKSNEQFIEEARIKHNNKFDYSLCKYIKNNIKVTIICPKHGEFKQTPQDHLKGNGCHRCNQSRGEIKIMEVLDQKKIVYNTQYRFKECKNINYLPFDFYLPEHNLCIEFQGIDHFEMIERSKSYEKNLKNHQARQKADQIKRDFCLSNSIDLLEIPYWDYDQIPEILASKLLFSRFHSPNV